MTVETALHADRLKKAAFELACDRGLAALSARALAVHTGGSPSAINYHFGNREQLLFALFGETVTCAANARDAALASGLETMPDWAELPHVFTAVLQARLARAPGACILLHELEQEVVAGREPQLRQMAIDEVVRERQFWCELAGRFGVSDAAAQVWADLALGLIGLLLCETDPAVRSAWISTPSVRLHQRIDRQSVKLVSRRKAALTPNPEAAVSGMPPTNSTACAILDAALVTIAKNGADRLTQRDVAAMAGVSLASVTYFFRTKHDLINAAFEELCRRMSAQVDGLEKHEAGGFSAIKPGLGEGGSHSLLGALNALLRAAARDVTLAPIAREIRQIRGIGSIVMLSKRGLATDWMDAYIWGVLIAGKCRQFSLTSPENTPAAIDKSAAETLKIVFDVESPPMQQPETQHRH